jgi:hypothetical protein
MLILILDFRRYAVNQENCQIKWLEAEDEVRHLKNQLNDANQVNSKLQAQYHQTTVLLKNEVKVRTHLQEEKKTLVDIFTLYEGLRFKKYIKHLNRKRSSNHPKKGLAQLKTMLNLPEEIVTQCQGCVRRLEIGCATKMSAIQTAWGHRRSPLKLLMRKRIAIVSCDPRVHDQVEFQPVRTVHQVLTRTSRLMGVSNADLDVT